MTSLRCTLARLQLVAVPLALLAGCAGTSLGIRDNSAPTYSARVDFRFAPGGGAGLELDAHGVRGEGRQQLSASETATLGGRTVNGPALLTHDARVDAGHVAYHHIHFREQPVQLEWFAGIGAARVRWRSVADVAGQSELAKTESWNGPMAGVGLRWRINPWVGLDARTWTMTELSFFDDNTRSGTEVALAFTPTPPLRLRLGWAGSTTRMQNSSIDSNVSLRTRGPFAGVALAF